MFSLTRCGMARPRAAPVGIATACQRGRLSNHHRGLILLRTDACVTKLLGGTSSVNQTLPPMVEPLPTTMRPQNGRARIDDDIVLDDRMARIALDGLALVIGREVPGSKRYRLIDSDAIADDGSFADHHAGAMVDEDAGAKTRARVNVDSRCAMRQLGDQPRHHRCPEIVKQVRDAVMDDRHHAG